jgi:hypothetical protein
MKDIYKIKEEPIKINVKGGIRAIKSYILSNTSRGDVYDDVNFMLNQLELFIRADERGQEEI